jgi:hypothetical protein
VESAVKGYLKLYILIGLAVPTYPKDRPVKKTGAAYYAQGTLNFLVESIEDIVLPLALFSPFFLYASRAAKKKEDCSICFEKKDGFYRLPCGNTFCVVCLDTIAQGAIEQNSSASLRCPDPDCRNDISDYMIDHSHNDEHRRKLQTIKDEEQGYFIKMSDPSLAEKATESATRICPQCNVAIYRSEGCNHMYCNPAQGGCGHQFCWLCGDDYPTVDGSYMHGNNKECSKRIFGE